MFEIQFATSMYASPRVVTIRTPGNDWEAIPGRYADGIWVFSLDEAPHWSKPSYFKFFLDGEVWMDDPYIRVAPTEGGTYNFDESRVTFSMDAATTPAPDMSPAPAMSPALAMSSAPTSAPAFAAPAAVPQVAVPAVGLTALTGDPSAAISEGAIINRVVVVATPVLAAGAAWAAGVLARHVPGVKLDQTQVVSFMIAIVAVCLASAWKWLQGWQQHEFLVAQKLAAPIKAIVVSSLENPRARS